ncbi:MAG: DUF3048 domain-containing protein, partial [Clostridia bacterium]|nr:DUF3048 domain-containing protein [Clostridia bacterium]
MKTAKILVSLVLCIVLALSAVSCGKDDGGDSTLNVDTAYEHTDTGKPKANVETEDPAGKEPKYINPLTGLEASEDASDKRPLGVMLNNIYEALPQVGIGDADILFECLAEGGITRLFALFDNYEDLGVIGSIRSSRPYYIDFAQMFDAIYCHAGGSEDAYANIANRGINNIDGVRGDPLGVYYRDEERMQTKAIEHTLMTTGEGITRTIEYCNYRTELRDGYDYPFEFPEWGDTYELKSGDDCKKIHLPISWYQTVDYEYDEKECKYLRYQYNGEK